MQSSFPVRFCKQRRNHKFGNKERDRCKDDYREKEVAPTKTFHTGEIRLEEDYLDEEDDYIEKEEVSKPIFNTGEIHLEEDYLDEDVDDYKEK